jgi:hypothetical protein
VLVPPSSTPSGVYQLLEASSSGSSLDFEQVRRALRPASRRHVSHGHTRDRGLEAFAANLAIGERNRGVFWAACQALRNGQSDLSGLFEVGVEIGLPEEEVRTVLRSARRVAGVS